MTNTGKYYVFFEIDMNQLLNEFVYLHVRTVKFIFFLFIGWR